MTRYYSPQEKSAVLTRLTENGGDIALTAFQMHIPERTLRGWRREAWIALQSTQVSQPEGTTDSPAAAATAAPPRQPPPELSQFEDDIVALGFMRRQIMSDLLSLSVQSSDGFTFMTPYQRGMMITQLIDRLMKLDQHLRPYTPQVTTVRVVREDKMPQSQTVEGVREDTNTPQMWIEVEHSAYGPFPLSELDDKMAYYQGLGLDPRIITHPSDEYRSSESE